jgi:metal-responsive CopG/Arc/MetJ family transcriptional regulator
MAVKKGKTRVQITLNDEVVKKLDELCDRTGMTKSSFVSYTVAMALDSYNGMLEKMAQAVAEQK